MLKNMSIRLKITLWFSIALLAVIGVTYFVILSVARQAINKSIENTLVETVAHNLSEVQYHSQSNDEPLDESKQYIQFNEGYLSIDEDFLNSLNGVFTSLYNPEMDMLYGENPIAKQTFVVDLTDNEVKSLHVNRVEYFIFDKAINPDQPENTLWLRGIVPETVGAAQYSSISRWSLVILPIIWLFAVIGGYIIATRTLRPIQQITKTAARIENSGNLSQRINIGKGNDEAHQLANTFDAMLEKLEHNFQNQKQFTADASHELRTPTSVIMAQSEFTLEKDRSVEEYKRSLGVIHRQSEKMSRLINDMLTFTRLDNNRGNYTMEHLDFSKLVRFVVSDMFLIKENNITLSSNVEDNIFINGNEELLTRLVSNLINNAYRYGKENGSIFVTLQKYNKATILKVKDDGPGIRKEEQVKIFERFYQSDNARNNKGTGLGLPMVKEIAVLHGAKVSVESIEGIGSEFIVSFS